jgi:hypothetical protein
MGALLLSPARTFALGKKEANGEPSEKSCGDPYMRVGVASPVSADWDSCKIDSSEELMLRLSELLMEPEPESVAAKLGAVEELRGRCEDMARRERLNKDASCK